MKKLIIALLLLTNVLSAMAFNVTIWITGGAPADIIVTDAQGNIVKSTATYAFVANLTEEQCNPLTIKAAEGLEIKEALKGGLEKMTIDEDGAFRDILTGTTSYDIKIQPAGTVAPKYNVRLDVDKASNVVVTKSNGEKLELTDGMGNVFELLEEDCSPLTIEPVSGVATLKSVKKNDITQGVSGDGKCRLRIDSNSMIEIRTETVVPPLPEGLNFDIANPDQVIIKIAGKVITDLSIPTDFNHEDELEVIPVEGYGITKCILGGSEIRPYDGKYIAYLRQPGHSGKALVVETQPLLTFDVDFLNRIKLFNNETSEPIEINPLGTPLANGTPLRLESSDEKYSLKTVKRNGIDGQLVGGVHNFGMNGPTHMEVTTNSTIPGIKFTVNEPSRVKAYLAGSADALDLNNTYEVEKNTKVIIESVSEEYRIASLEVNGFKQTPLANGKYEVIASKDLLIEINARMNIPALTFKVDAPERIKVWKGEEELNIAELVELERGTDIVIEPAREDFRIKSLLANNEALTPDDDQKYRIKVNEDIDFDIQTAASLTLNIVQPEGGTISVSRNGEELQHGDKVNTGEILFFKNVPNDTYIFTEYTVNGKMNMGRYVVTGSEDITVTGVFRTVKEGYTLVEFDFDVEFINVRNTTTGEMLENLAFPHEIENGTKLSVHLLSVGRYFESVLVNGVEVSPDEDDARFYTIEVTGDNMVIKATTYKKVTVSGEMTTYPKVNDVNASDFIHSLATLGQITLKCNGETGTNLLVSVGDVIELVPVVLRDGFEFKYAHKNMVNGYYDPENNKIEGSTYTVTQEDVDRESGMVVFKGVFELIESSIESIGTVESYYDASAMQIVTGGGRTEVYSISGEKVLDSDDTRIGVSNLEKGIYIVKSQERLFKMSK